MTTVHCLLLHLLHYLLFVKGKPLDILLLQSTKGKVPLALYLYEGKLVLNCVKPESTIDSILKSVWPGSLDRRLHHCWEFCSWLWSGLFKIYFKRFFNILEYLPGLILNIFEPLSWKNCSIAWFWSFEILYDFSKPIFLFWIAWLWRFEILYDFSKPNVFKIGGVAIMWKEQTVSLIQ